MINYGNAGFAHTEDSPNNCDIVMFVIRITNVMPFGTSGKSLYWIVSKSIEVAHYTFVEQT